MADPRNPEAKFRSNVLEAINRIGDNVSSRLDSTERATAENTKAIAQLGTKIDKLTDTVSAQAQSIDRLERAISSLVSGIESQRKTMADMVTQQAAFLALATRQADIIGDLAKGRAA